MSCEKYLKIVENTVENILNRGCIIEHNINLGYFGIDMSNDDGYFICDAVYEQFLEEYDDSWLNEYISLEDYVLYCLSDALLK